MSLWHSLGNNKEIGPLIVDLNADSIHLHLQSSYKTEEQLKKLDEGAIKGPNLEILAHEKKRKVELKCLEMTELMEEQG